MEETVAEENVQVKKHPPWKQALDKIRERQEQEGYGFFISDNEIDEMLSIKAPTGICTVEEYDKYECQRLQIYETIKKLLRNYDICLYIYFGSDGFVVLHPNDQVTVAYPKQRAKTMRELRQCYFLLSNIANDLLSTENEVKRNEELVRLEFARRGLNKRKLTLVENKKHQLENKKK